MAVTREDGQLNLKRLFIIILSPAHIDQSGSTLSIFSRALRGIDNMPNGAAIAAVNGYTCSAGDKTDNGISGHRVTAASQPHQAVTDPSDLNAAGFIDMIFAFFMQQSRMSFFKKFFAAQNRIGAVNDAAMLVDTVAKFAAFLFRQRANVLITQFRDNPSDRDAAITNAAIKVIYFIE